MNYTVIICFNDYNNAVINNNYGRLQDFIMLFKISMVTRKNFFGLYRKFWHAPSKRFASCGLVDIPTELFGLQTTIIGFQRMCLPETHSVWSSDLLCSARFGFLTTLLMKFRIFFDITPCKLTYWYRRFGGACCCQLQGSFGFLWNFVTYQNTRHDCPKACGLQTV
jgi:hypothetical protein